MVNNSLANTKIKCQWAIILINNSNSHNKGPNNTLNKADNSINLKAVNNTLNKVVNNFLLKTSNTGILCKVNSILNKEVNSILNKEVNNFHNKLVNNFHNKLANNFLKIQIYMLNLWIKANFNNNKGKIKVNLINMDNLNNSRWYHLYLDKPM